MADDLKAKLRARATVWAGNITKKANQTPGKPKHISVKSTVTEKGGLIEIVSTGSSPKGDARAYEYGSGIHSRRSTPSKKQMGAKGKILIKPTGGKKVLAFQWDVASAHPEDFMMNEKGQVLLRSVQHPGVVAAGGGKGYLAPAINEVRKQIRKEVPLAVRQAALGQIRKAFKKK